MPRLLTLALKLLPSLGRSLPAPLAVLIVCLCLLPVAAVIKSYAESTSVVSSTPPLARLSDVVTIKTKGRGNPSVRLSDGHDIVTPYVGPRELRAALEQNQAEPMNLASADFDEDGTPDLVTGYSFQDRGIVTLMRGNVDAIYPNAPAAKQRRANGTFTHAPFLSPAYVFSTPVAAEFIAAGDFDGDSHWDVIVASSYSAALYLLAGNGKGEFPTVKKMALPGLVTALTAGETNRRDGLTDVIVGIGATAKPQVLVFEGPSGAFNSTPEVFPMPARVASLALGQLDDSYEIDLLVAAGSELILVHGRDRQLLTEPDERVRVPAPRLERRSFPGVIRDLTLGDFKAQQKMNAAVMMGNGDVQLLDAGATAGAPLAEWKIETLERNWSNASKIITAKVSSLPGDDLLVSDADSSTIQIARSASSKLNTQSSKLNTQISASDSGLLSTIQGVDTAPVAILPMRLNSDPFSDLTILKRGSVSAAAMTTQAAQTFVVTNTNDSGPGSLRQAVLNSEQNPGADSITFQIGSGPQTIALQSFLPLIGDPVTIDATTQPGYAGQPLIELDGTNCTVDFPAFAIFAGNTTIRGFVINRFQSNGINISQRPGNIIEGNYLGTDKTGTIALPNRNRGVEIGEAPDDARSTNNRIGGTTAQARNLISGNKVHGIRILNSLSTNNVIQGNYIGTDVTGTKPLGNFFEGIYIGGGNNNTVGGTTAGARNIVSANGFQGTGRTAGLAISTFPLQVGASGNIVQGNYIGTNATGTAALGNGHEGLLLEDGATSNLVGGTTAAARNLISGNNTNGLDVGFSKPVTLNQILGNYIGTDVTGETALGNVLHGIFINVNSVNNIIRDNRIAFNGGTGVFIPNDTPEPGDNPGVRIAIDTNEIYANSGLGIDLGNAGVTANDPLDTDVGANLQQNFPVLTSVVSSLLAESVWERAGEVGREMPDPMLAAALTINGTLNSTPNSTFTVHWYFSNDAQCTTNQAATRPLATGRVPNVMTNGSGDAQFSFDFDFPADTTGGVINCTATDSQGNTSEFSSCFSVSTPTRTLTVSSSNPASGVGITVSPNDNSSQGNGTTQFTRTYNHNTAVSLTAPATASGNNFQKWLKDGADFANNSVSNVSVTMDANHTMTAVYVPPPRTLTVASSNPASGVGITVSPNDNSSQGNGTTQFTRTYNHNTAVSLTAPATASGNNFQKWLKDGADFANNSVSNVSVTMDANHTMTAVYVTPGPSIFVEDGTNNLAALDSISRVRGPFALTNTSNFSSDQRTRIIFFTADLGFAETAQPDINTLSVQIGGNSYPVESVAPNTTTGGSQIIFRLPDLSPGTYPLGIRIRGVNSANAPNVTIVSSSSSLVATSESNTAKLVEYLLFSFLDLIV